MKQINLASAVASTLHTFQVRVATCVPGLGGIQCYDEFEKQRGRDSQYSFHEEIAFSVAYGAAIAGTRSCAFLKSHGLAKAMNIAVNAAVAGTRAACVIFVFDDPTGESSDIALDAEQVVKGSGLIYRIPKIDEVTLEIRKAVEESERDGEVQVIILPAKSWDTMVSEDGVSSSPGPSIPRIQFDREGFRFLLCPPMSRYHQEYLNWRRGGAVGKRPTPPIIGPVPNGLPDVIRPTVEAYKPFFDYFRKVRGDLVFGDTSLSLYYAFEPYSCVDTCLQMGGAIQLAIGAYEAGIKDPWVVAGDFSFLSMAPIALIEAIARKSPLKIVVFNNGKAAATGNQPVKRDVLDTALLPYSKFTRYMRSPQDVSSVVDEAHKSPELRILVYETA